MSTIACLSEVTGLSRDSDTDNCCQICPHCYRITVPQNSLGLLAELAN
uniref:Uncharacterized protein n=1 Tax=Anguilla anguilla TaxID=7936 RepID=A0A0E9UER5_ANGAN